MYGAGFDGDRSKADGAASLDQLLVLQQTNERLRAIVAELLLKNQALRWKLADSGSSEILQTSLNESDS
jgi:hypothetical protein